MVRENNLPTAGTVFARAYLRNRRSFSTPFRSGWAVPSTSAIGIGQATPGVLYHMTPEG